jgi:hypothetical protein
MKRYPKSPNEETRGMKYFPRMLDKIRRHAADELPEDYHANLGQGFDKRCLSFLRVEYPQLIERVQQGGSDEEVLGWCFENGRRLDESDLFVWNSFVSKFGWRDIASQRLEELKQKSGVGDRPDIVTIADLIDLDEERIS